MDCIFCGKQLGPRQARYCSNRCQADATMQQKVSDWQSGKLNGHTGKTLKVSTFVRRYLLQKHQNRCQKCGYDRTHPVSNTSILEVNHIDGDASNSKESNLELLCPNCHALSSNFRNRNYGNGRRVR